MTFDYMQVQSLLQDDRGNPNWNQYLRYRKDIYLPLVNENLNHNMISEANWHLRSQLFSAEEVGVQIAIGDICYIDFGQAYINEMGYQHFGLIMSMCRHKALVIPMTSNEAQYESAYDATKNPMGKIHLMRLGLVAGLVKPSVLFLNDMKYINTARVIDVKGHIDIHSSLFHQIQQRMLQMIFTKEL